MKISQRLLKYHILRVFRFFPLFLCQTPSENPDSPIYGMPVLNADAAKNCIVIKRGKGSGFSGIENHLFYADNTRMLYGDGQKAVGELIAGVKQL